MVLPELAGGVAEVLEEPADRRIELAHAHRRAREADLAEPRADDVLAGQEGRSREAIGTVWDSAVYGER
jgi:hypothetical protein